MLTLNALMAADAVLDPRSVPVLCSRGLTVVGNH